MVDKFNIRVYGLWLHDRKVLLAREWIGQLEMVKFPGGGLELGEGTVEGLKREFSEELEIELDQITHFYTTDFFQRSAFRKNEQIISIYFIVNSHDHSFEMEKTIHPEHKIEFFWKELSELKEENVTFPIDKKVVALLLGESQRAKT